MNGVHRNARGSGKMAKHTVTPWHWIVHDHSMASLGHGDSPGIGDPLVLAISPCQACADRAEPREWKWGRCHTPSEADADFIVTAVNNHDALVDALQKISSLGVTGGAAANLAERVLSAVSAQLAPSPERK